MNNDNPENQMDDFEYLLNGGNKNEAAPAQVTSQLDFSSLDEIDEVVAHSKPLDPPVDEQDPAFWESLIPPTDTTVSTDYLDGYTEGVNAIIVDPRNGIATKGAIVTNAAISRAGGWKITFETTEEVLGAHIQDVRKGSVRLIAVPEQHYNQSIDDAVNALIRAIQAHQ